MNIARLLLGLCLVLLISHVEASNIITIKTPSGEPYQGVVFVEKYGAFNTSLSGEISLDSDVEFLIRSHGLTQPHPGTLSYGVFIPQTKYSGNKWVEVKSLVDSVIVLEPLQKMSADYVFRSICCLSITDVHDRPSTSVKVELIDVSGIIDVNASGMIHGQVLVPVDKQKFKAIVYGYGYQLKLIDIILPVYENPQEGIVYLNEKSITLEYSKFATFQLKVTNFGVVVQKDWELVHGYYQDIHDKMFGTALYLYGYIKPGNPTSFIGASVALIPPLIIKNQVLNFDELNFTIVPGEFEDEVSLSHITPRVNIDTASIVFTSSKITKIPLVVDSTASRLTRENLDENIKISIWISMMIFLIIILVQNDIILVRYGDFNLKDALRSIVNRAERRKSTHNEKITRVLSLLDFSNPEDIHIVAKALEVLDNKSLKDRSLRHIIKRAIASIESIGDMLQNLIETKKSLVKKKEDLLFKKNGLVSTMQAAFCAQSYDMALSYKDMIEEAQLVLNHLNESLDGMDDAIEDKKKTLLSLCDSLKDLITRAELTAKHSQMTESLVIDMDELKKVLDDASLVMSNNQSTHTYRRSIDSKSKQRKKVRSTGITASDVSEMSDFLKSMDV